jgi:hypothetical protein
MFLERNKSTPTCLARSIYLVVKTGHRSTVSPIQGKRSSRPAPEMWRTPWSMVLLMVKESRKGAVVAFRSLHSPRVRRHRVTHHGR